MVLLNALNSIRDSTVPLLSPLVVRLNDELGSDIYISYEQGRHEFLGVVDLSQSELESRMKDMGFELNPLAAWKTLAGTSEAEQGTWRYVNANEEYFGLDAPSAALEYEREDGHAHQLHIILYELDENSGTTAVCAHHELAWDAYPLKHYSGEYYNPEFGIAMFTEMLRENLGEEFTNTVNTNVSVEGQLVKHGTNI